MMIKRYTQGYTIISDGTDYFVAEVSNKMLGGPNIVAKLNTEKRHGSFLVSRGSAYYPSAIEVGDLVIHLRAETDHNMVSISGADPVNMPWAMVGELIDAQERKIDFDQRKAHANVTIKIDGEKIAKQVKDIQATVERSLEETGKRGKKP